MVTWLPFYLVRERHMTMAGMSRVAALYYLTDATSAFASGWLADVWMRHGGGTTLVRKTAMGVGCALSAISLACLSIATPETYLYCLLATGVGAGSLSRAPSPSVRRLPVRRGSVDGPVCRMASPTWPA